MRPPLLALLLLLPLAHLQQPAGAPVSLVWDVDKSSTLDTPPGVTRGDRGLSCRQRWCDGQNGNATNIYGHLGSYPDLTRGINGGIPQRGNLTAHLVKFRRDLAALVPAADYVGYCLLDFEQFRADWNSSDPAHRAASVRAAGGNATLAKLQFEAAAKDFMLGTIAAVKALRPGCKTGYYGYPRNLLGAAGPGYGPDAAGDAQRRLNDELAWLFEASTAVFPSVYLGILPQDSRHSVATNKLYIQRTVAEAIRLSGRDKVVPVTWTLYDNYPRTPRMHRLTAEDLSTEVGGPIEAGAKALLLWGATSNTTPGLSAAELQAYVRTELAPVVSTICQKHGCAKHGSGAQKTDDSGAIAWGVAPAALNMRATSVPAGPASRAVDLAGQLGECEHAQIWLRAPAELTNCSVSFPAMRSSGSQGHSLPPSTWGFRQQGYVFNNCSASGAADAWNPCQEGWLPDPLLPPVAGVGVPRIPPNFTQPLFIDLCIPRGSAPGNYSCEAGECITVSGFADGAAFAIHVQAAVEIWPIVLPSVNSSSAFSTIFSIGEGGCVNKNGSCVGGTDDTTSQPLGGGGLSNFYPRWFDSGNAMRSEWYGALARHRTPADDLYLMDYRSVEEYQLLANSGAKWMNIAYTNCCPENSTGCRGTYSGSFCNATAIISHLRPIVRKLTDLGLIDRAYIYGFVRLAPFSICAHACR